MKAQAPRYRVRPSLRLSTNGFLIDMSNAESFTLNDTGQLVVRLLLDGRPSDEIFLDVAEEFDVSPSRAQHDVEHYLVRLCALELVTKESSG